MYSTYIDNGGNDLDNNKNDTNEAKCIYQENNVLSVKYKMCLP